MSNLDRDSMIYTIKESVPYFKYRNFDSLSNEEISTFYNTCLRTKQDTDAWNEQCKRKAS